MRLLLVPSGEIKPLNVLNGTRTLERTEEALRLWHTGEYDLMLLSGGIYEPDYVQTKSAADLMYEWLQKQPNHPRPHQVFCETKSRDTYENARFSVELLRREHVLGHVTDITLVTQKLHAIRFRITLTRGYHLSPVLIHATRGKLPRRVWLLELCYIVLHWLDPLGNNWLAQLNRRDRTP